MPEKSRISVVMPAMNEQENIAPFYDALTKVTDRLSNFDWEFIFVDDGSTDATAERLLALRDRDTRVKILQLSKNFGSHAAIRAGMDHALGDAVICISVDLQDPPELFLSFTELWQKGHEIVWGVRAQRDDPWSKKVVRSIVLQAYAQPRAAGITGAGNGLWFIRSQGRERFLPDTRRSQHNLYDHILDGISAGPRALSSSSPNPRVVQMAVEKTGQISSGCHDVLFVLADSSLLVYRANRRSDLTDRNRRIVSEQNCIWR